MRCSSASLRTCTTYPYLKILYLGIVVVPDEQRAVVMADNVEVCEWLGDQDLW